MVIGWTIPDHIDKHQDFFFVCKSSSWSATFPFLPSITAWLSICSTLNLFSNKPSGEVSGSEGKHKPWLPSEPRQLSQPLRPDFLRNLLQKHIQYVIVTRYSTRYLNWCSHISDINSSNCASTLFKCRRTGAGWALVYKTFNLSNQVQTSVSLTFDWNVTMLKYKVPCENDTA